MNTDKKVCAQCKKQIKEKSYLTCSRCQLSYDLKCSNKEKLYDLMNKERKAKWVCMKCHQKTRKSTVNPNLCLPTSHKTPVLAENPTVQKIKDKEIENVKTIITNTNTSPQSTDLASDFSTPNNNTYRKEQCQVNIPVSNSFDSLQTDLDDNECTEILNDTPKKLNRSCPEILVRSHLDFESLQMKFDSLQQKYDSAEYQIELLVSENFSLKKQIKEYKSKMSNLTLVCQSNENTPTTKSRHRSTLSAKRSSNKMHTPITLHQRVHNEEWISAPISPQGISERSKKLGQVLTKTFSETTERTTEEFKQRKLCVLSTNTKNKVLNTVLRTFQEDYQACHYITPHKGILEILDTIDEKIKSFTKDDFCVLMVGSKDFETSQNYNALVRNIRMKLIAVDHTNVVICLPTFKCGAFSDIYNRRIEIFNRILYTDIQELEYAFIHDSNLELSYDYNMFSGIQGTINNKGMQIVISNLKHLIDNILWYYTDSTDFGCNNNDASQEQREDFFR